MVDLSPRAKLDGGIDSDGDATEAKESFEYHGLPDGKMSETFVQAIIECCRHTDANEPCRHTVFNEELVLTGCVAGVTSPFSHVTGTHEDNLVIVTKKEACLDSNNQNAIDDELHQFKPPFTCSVHTQATPMSTRATPIAAKDVSHTDLPSTPTQITLRDNHARPLSLDKARHLASLYTTWHAAHLVGQPPPELWILCEGSKDVVALGCSANSRTMRTMKVAKLSSLSFPAMGSSLKLNEYLPKSRASRKAAAIGTNNDKKYSVNSVYEFGPALHGMDEEFLVTSLSGMKMRFTWDSVEPCISAPSTSAKALLSVSVTPGYQVSPVLSIFCEIQRLFELSKMTESDNILCWSEMGESVLDLPSPLISKVDTFLEELSIHMTRAVDVSILSPTAILSPFQPREDLDFLGQLWVFLMAAPSPDDLVGSLALVLKAILLDQVQPFIHQNKQSNLAVLCRRNLASSSPDEHQVIAMKLQSILTEERALKCLVEIGIEKMQRDYWSFFTINELCTGSELERFFVRRDSLLDQCKMLCKLHCVIELTACLMSFLSLPKSSLVMFVGQSLDYYYQYTFEDFSATPTFNLPFTAFNSGLKILANFAASLKPSASSVSFGSAMDQHVLYCSLEPLFQYLARSESPSAEDEESTMYVYRANIKTE